MAATLPAAPGRFSTMIGCLMLCATLLETRRTTMSELPPGGNGTMMVMGRDGYSSAHTEACATSTKATMTNKHEAVRLKHKTIQALRHLGNSPNIAYSTAAA